MLVSDCIIYCRARFPAKSLKIFNHINRVINYTTFSRGKMKKFFLLFYLKFINLQKLSENTKKKFLNYVCSCHENLLLSLIIKKFNKKARLCAFSAGLNLVYRRPNLKNLSHGSNMVGSTWNFFSFCMEGQLKLQSF